MGVGFRRVRASVQVWRCISFDCSPREQLEEFAYGPTFAVLAFAGRKLLLGCSCTRRLFVPSRICLGICDCSERRFAEVTIGRNPVEACALGGIERRCIIVVICILQGFKNKRRAFPEWFWALRSSQEGDRGGSCSEAVLQRAGRFVEPPGRDRRSACTFSHLFRRVRL